MEVRDLDNLSVRFERYASEIQMNCSGDCHNCDYGVMRGYGDSDECIFEIALDSLYKAAKEFHIC